MYIGAYIGEVFMDLLQEYQLTDKLFCITTDNGSNMGTMMDYIEGATNGSFKKEEHWISCAGHVINLSAQALLGNGLRTQAPSGNMNVYEMNEEDDGHVNYVNIRDSVKKLRRGIIRIQ